MDRIRLDDVLYKQTSFFSKSSDVNPSLSITTTSMELISGVTMAAPMTATAPLRYHHSRGYYQPQLSADVTTASTNNFYTTNHGTSALSHHQVSNSQKRSRAYVYHSQEQSH